MGIKIRCTYEHEYLQPTYSSIGAAGADLKANIKEQIVLSKGQRTIIPTGVNVEIPPGFEAQIRPRSGLALSHGVTVLNSPGTIDSDYRGEIKIILINTGDEDYTIRKGDRIAQMVITPVVQAAFIKVPELEPSRRNSGGFGSTGQ